MEKKTTLPAVEAEQITSATPTALARRRAIHEVSIVVATMDFAVRIAEPTDMVRPAKRALAPSLMDVPTAAPSAATTDGAPSVPSARVGMPSGPTLHEAPGLLAAAHSSGAIAEETSAMNLTEGLPPRVK